MKLSFLPKYCKSDTWPNWWHAGSASPSATSPSRQDKRTGLWGNSCCSWMGSVLGMIKHFLKYWTVQWSKKSRKYKRERERERLNPCNVCDKAFKSLPMSSQHKIWQNISHLFVCKGCGKKLKTNNTPEFQYCLFIRLVSEHILAGLNRSK